MLFNNYCILHLANLTRLIYYSIMIVVIIVASLWLLLLALLIALTLLVFILLGYSSTYTNIIRCFNLKSSKKKKFDCKLFYLNPHFF